MTPAKPTLEWDQYVRPYLTAYSVPLPTQNLGIPAHSFLRSLAASISLDRPLKRQILIWVATDDIEADSIREIFHIVQSEEADFLRIARELPLDDPWHRDLDACRRRAAVEWRSVMADVQQLIQSS